MARIEKKKYFAKGKHGIIYTAIYDEKKVAIKQKNPKTPAEPIENEAKMLQLVNTKGIGPKFVKSTKASVMYIFEEGIPFDKWMESASKKQLAKALLNLLNQCYVLDQLKINKLEMMRPYSNVIYNKTPVLIDFERAYESKQPKNVTQFLQFLTNYALLKEKGLALNRKKVIPLAKKYKENQTKENFEKILKFVSTSFSS